MSFLGFIIAAPGAVMISGPVGRRRNGKISMAGPLTNIVLALLFFILSFLTVRGIINVPGIIKPVLFLGFFINSLLALFNMIPLGNFDGRKVLTWNKVVYFSMLIVSVVFFYVSYNYYFNLRGGMI